MQEPQFASFKSEKLIDVWLANSLINLIGVQMAVYWTHFFEVTRKFVMDRFPNFSSAQKNMKSNF